MIRKKTTTGVDSCICVKRLKAAKDKANEGMENGKERERLFPALLRVVKCWGKVTKDRRQESCRERCAKGRTL